MRNRAKVEFEANFPTMGNSTSASFLYGVMYHVTRVQSSRSCIAFGFGQMYTKLIF